MHPFIYPTQPHVRRHGPQGYAGAEGYRPWLRDEFAFRCIYCLFRDSWARLKATFQIDHFLPIASDPQQALNYDNLLWCCATCNAAKNKRHLPNPEQALLADDVWVNVDGTIETRSADALKIIRVLGLDDPEATEYRLLWLGIISMAYRYDPDLFRKLMGFPADLPNLARLRPPGGNSRPDGVGASYFQQREQNVLPEAY
jgi:hypothetical protein